jgi:heat shock protein HslJ
MTTHLRYRAVGLVVLGLSSQALGVDATSDPSSALEGTVWILSTFPSHALLPDRKVTMQFADGKVQGSDGCNRYRVAYTLESGHFSLAPEMIKTLAGCPPEVMKQAAAFCGAMFSTRVLRTTGKKLTLLGEDGTTLAILDAQNQDLRGTSWRLTLYYDSAYRGLTMQLPGDQALEFSTDGILTGFAGCNPFSGRYLAEGSRIEVSDTLSGPHFMEGSRVEVIDLAASQKICAGPEGVMQHEADFLNALRRSATAFIDADRLELRDGGGSVMVIARQASAGTSARTSTDSGHTVGADANVLRVQAGWPGIWVDVIHGFGPSFELGGRVGFNYAFQGIVTNPPGTIGGSSGSELLFQVLLRQTLLELGSATLAATFNPGFLLHFVSPPPGTGGGNSSAITFPIGLQLGFPVAEMLVLNASLEVPFFVTLPAAGAVGYLYIPILAGGGIEYRLQPSLALTLKLAVGGTFGIGTSYEEFTLQAMAGVAYRF